MGQASSTEKPAERQRGWFPRKCAVDVIDNSKRWQQQQQHAKSCDLHEDVEETTAERVLRNREKIAASGRATKKGEEKKDV